MSHSVAAEGVGLRPPLGASSGADAVSGQERFFADAQNDTLGVGGVFGFGFRWGAGGDGALAQVESELDRAWKVEGHQ